MKASESLALNFWMAASLHAAAGWAALQARCMAQRCSAPPCGSAGIAGPSATGSCRAPVLQAGAAVDAQVAHGAAAQGLQGAQKGTIRGARPACAHGTGGPLGSRAWAAALGARPRLPGMRSSAPHA